MEEKAKEKAKRKNSSLKHRFAQILLGSSCTSTATTTAPAAAKPVKISSPQLHAREPQEVHSDCGHDKRLTHHRRKLDRSTTSSVASAYGNCFTPRVDPGAQVPLGCTAGARHSIHTSDPLASRTPGVEKNDGKKERRRTEGAEFYEAFSREEKKMSAAMFPSARTPMRLSHGSHREEETKNKNTSEKRCKINRKETMKLSSTAYGYSSSSSFDSGNDLGLCTSDEGEEEEESPCTLFSSRSFSSDSSEFYQSNRKKKKNRNNNSINTKKEEKNRRASMKSTRPSPSPRPPRGDTKPRSRSWDAGDKFQPLVSYSCSNAEKHDETTAETKVTTAAGLAVVKRSSDPYKDFRNSMVEMIVERNISSANDLEDLLQSYLSLNAARHHPAIVDAFSDIWNAIFCCLD